MKPSAEETKFRNWLKANYGNQGSEYAGTWAEEIAIQYAHNSVDQLKKEHETHVIALEALAKVLNREKGELREENDKLRKERDEFAKAAFEAGRNYQRGEFSEYHGGPEHDYPDFTEWISEYKKTLEP